jgi:hypothetical protein
LGGDFEGYELLVEGGPAVGGEVAKVGVGGAEAVNEVVLIECVDAELHLSATHGGVQQGSIRGAHWIQAARESFSRRARCFLPQPQMCSSTGTSVMPYFEME